MDILDIANLGAKITAKRLANQGSLTAAGTGDATTVTCATIDRMAFISGSMPESLLLAIPYSATLASGATLSVTVDVQDSADNSAFSDFSTIAATVVDTGGSGGSVQTGMYETGHDLRAARRYIRVLYVPDLSATGTDTAVATPVAVFGGFDRLPAPAR